MKKIVRRDRTMKKIVRRDTTMKKIVEKKDGVIILSLSKGSYYGKVVTLTLVPDSDDNREIRKSIEFDKSEVWLAQSIFDAILVAMKNITAIYELGQEEEND